MVLHACCDFSRDFLFIGVHRLVAICDHLQATPGGYFVDQSKIMARPDGLCRISRIQPFLLSKQVFG